MLGADQRNGTRWPTSTCTSPTAPSSSTTSRSRSSRCNAGDPALRAAGKAFRDGVIERARRAGLAAAGVLSVVRRIRQPAIGLRGRRRPAALLARLHRSCAIASACWWRRIRGATTRTACASPATRSSPVLELVARARRATGRQQAQAADARAAQARRPAGRARLQGQRPSARTIAFRGYAYTRTPSEVSGALMTRYDETTPQVWNIPLRDDVQPGLRRRPRRAPATWCRRRTRTGSRAKLRPARHRLPPHRAGARRARGSRRSAPTRPSSPRSRSKATSALTLGRRSGSPRPQTSAPARCSCRSRSPRRGW